MSIDRLFSQKSKALISESREVALDLGYDYISTMHFFLADCRLGGDSSIKHFSFEDDAAFEAFYEKARIGKKLITGKNVPLTIEAEKTINEAGPVARKWRSKKVNPCHIFLTALALSSTVLYSSLEPEGEVLGRLEQFYKNLEQIPGSDKNIPRTNKWKNPISAFLDRLDGI